MNQLIRGLLVLSLFCLPSLKEAKAEDMFDGDQTFYELSYAADFELDFVARLTKICTGAAAPFVIAKFPDPSFHVKRRLLGFKIGFISKNPYTGTRLNVATEDHRRPSWAAEVAAQEVEQATNSSNSRDYLCDAYLWNEFEVYADAQLALVNYSVESLKKQNRSDDLAKLIADVSPLFIRIQKLVNGDPNIDRKWSYNLEASPEK